ncbi:inactive transglutaminase family protein [Thaumasiovibrio subtropicus]|uniref:inactive transglutaminase family protein n=1 Tax=Thaumasiovibrio subtropicus TaxID=1891207 RepID=UPI000B35533C|nr:inactive transglutaminase family protein [Thaumasiovibrio subtropicus]
MVSRTPFYLLITLLIIGGLSLTWHRHVTYGVPLLPNRSAQVWELEARVEFEAIGEAVKVSLAAPETQPGFTLINETTSSPGYGVAMIDNDNSRRVEWSIREAEGRQILYYKTQMLVDTQAQFANEAPESVSPRLMFDGSQQKAAEALIETARQQSADDVTFTRQVIMQFSDVNNQNAGLLLNYFDREDLITTLLAMEAIPAKIVSSLMLEDGRRRQSVTPMIQIWDGEQWLLFDATTGHSGKPENLLIWNQSNMSLLDVIGGQNSTVSFSYISQDITPRAATEQKVIADNLLNFSIHSLPIEEQAMFKGIMLVPIGALVVVFLRILVGLKTSGTFMPVLIAMSFVQTQLLTGIVGFVLIVGVGLVIRSYLSKLNLLLVARISAVIITVILIISAFTVTAYKIGLVEGLTITFFPMIILSWTIERMSILWEEEGAKEVLVQGGGSLLTAVMVYAAMTSDIIRHLTFNFIGLQFLILALILVLGNYTGYRLSELRRFKPLAED